MPSLKDKLRAQEMQSPLVEGVKKVIRKLKKK